MFTSRCVVFLLILCCLSPCIIRATLVNDLYSAQIPVTDQNSTQRRNAVKTAFLAVIVKVTGNSQLASQRSIVAAANNVQSYIQQYSYEDNPNPKDTQHPFILQIDFTPKAINSFLLQQNLPVWGQDRPLTLFWIVLHDNNQTQLIGADSASNVATLVDQDSDQRGIPAILPMLDLTDLNIVTPNDVIAPFPLTLQHAASRYGSNAMVVLRINKTPNKVNSRWTLMFNDLILNWYVSGDTVSDVLNQGVNQVADNLAQQYSVSESMQQTELEIFITGLHSLTSFADAKNYLESLAPVKSASIDQISGDGVSFKVSLVGSIADLQRVIGLDHTLTTTSAQLPQPTDQDEDDTVNMEPKLEYQWNR